MGQEPEIIRADIERTRAEMGDTVEALGYKADVKSRAKDKVTETKDRLTGKVSDVTGSVTGTVSDKTPDTQQVKRAAGIAQWPRGEAELQGRQAIRARIRASAAGPA